MEPGLLFVFEDETPLTRDALVREVRAALSRMGIDLTPYSGHSYRSGVASTAAAAGVAHYKHTGLVAKLSVPAIHQPTERVTRVNIISPCEPIRSKGAAEKGELIAKPSVLW